MKFVSQSLLYSIIFTITLFLSACGDGTPPPVVTRAPVNVDTVTLPQLPAAPTNLRIMSRDESVILEWDAVNTALTYNVYLASETNVSPSSYQSLSDGAKLTTADNPYTVTDLVNDRAYYFIVTANNNVGESSSSAIVTAAPNPLPTAVIHTNRGDITLELYPEEAPLTVSNFEAYSISFYNDTIIHRVVDSPDVIQGGGFTHGMVGKITNPSIESEADNGLSNVAGTIAMARLSDPDSATSQFFINVTDNTNLDFPGEPTGGYTVFGQVTAGMEVVIEISGVATAPFPDPGGGDDYENVPVDEIVVSSVDYIPVP